MGGRVSARIEKALGLPAGTLDRLPDNGDINPELVALCEGMTDEEMKRLEAFAAGLVAARGANGYSIIQQNDERGPLVSGSANRYNTKLLGSTLYGRSMTIQCNP